MSGARVPLLVTYFRSDSTECFSLSLSLSLSSEECVIARQRRRIEGEYESFYVRFHVNVCETTARQLLLLSSVSCPPLLPPIPRDISQFANCEVSRIRTATLSRTLFRVSGWKKKRKKKIPATGSNGFNGGELFRTRPRNKHLELPLHLPPFGRGTLKTRTDKTR